MTNQPNSQTNPVSAQDPQLATLFAEALPSAERDLAARYAPILCFDRREPFLPLAGGVTLFRQDGESPSFPRRIELSPPGQPPATLAIEYAIWWDWDIQHLYELEHVWVYVDGQGRVVRVEASWHGGYHEMAQDGQPSLRHGQARVYSEPGKHAFAPTPDWFRRRWQAQKRHASDALAGAGGVWVTPLFEEELRDQRTPENNTLVRTYLLRQAFQPSWDFSQEFRLQPDQLVPWPALAQWIPQRVRWWLDRLHREIPAGEYRPLRLRSASIPGDPGRAGRARGGQNGESLEGLRARLDPRVDALHVPVRATADGQAIVRDGALVQDLDGRGVMVHQASLAQLQALDAPGRASLLLLEQVLELSRQEDVGLYLEILDGEAIPAIVQAYDRYDLVHRAILGSFRADWLAALRDQLPRAATALLFDTVQVDAVALAQAVGADYVHPRWEGKAQASRLLTPEWLARVRDAGLGVIAWPESRPEEAARLERLGVDGLYLAG